jgi:tetratricopeptide (TPR) repeat protein
MHCPICGTLADTLLTARSDTPPPAVPSTGADDTYLTRLMPSGRDTPVPRQALLEVEGYELLGVLGRGGAGVVYKARQVALDRLVALKVLATGIHAGPDELARFRGEAEAVARLQHPNIVQIYDVGDTSGRPYLALEFMAGGSLAAKLADKPQPAREAAEMVRTLARAVHHAHVNHILHRDLKPGNVLLAADGTPKVADFGLAKRLDLDTVAQARLTPTGAIVGTPSYMASEQASGVAKHLGPSVDIYALGAILYEMLTGRPPFLGETLTDTLYQVLDMEPIAPRRLNPVVPRDLETICLRCLQKRPASRYASAAALADDLERFLDGRPILARPVGRIERAIKWARRRPAQAALLAVSTLALLLGAAGVAWHQIELHGKNVALTDALDAEAQLRRRNVQLLRLALEQQSEYGSYLDDQLKPLPRLTRMRRELLQKRLRFLQPFIDQEPTDLEMRQTQAQAYLEKGVIEERLGETSEAATAYQTAIGRLEVPAEEATPGSRLVLARLYVQYGMLQRHRGEDEAAADLLERGQRILEQLVADDSSPENRRTLALAHHNRGLFLDGKGQFEPARQAYKRSIELRRQLITEDPNNDRYRFELAGTYNNLGGLYLREGQLDRAREEFDRAIDLMRRLPPDAENRYLVAGIYHNLGNINFRQQKPREAIESLQHAATTWSALLADFPDVPKYQHEAASTHFMLGVQHELNGETSKAQNELRQCLALSRQLFREEAGTPAALRDLTQALYHLGRLLQASGKTEEAEALWREEAILLNKAVREKPNELALHDSLSFVLGQLGELDGNRGIQRRFAPSSPLLPSPPHIGIALHNLVLLALGPAYLRRSADEYRRSIHERRQILKLGPPRRIDFDMLDMHAKALAVVAVQRGSYEDMADAAEGLEEVARGQSAEPDNGQRYLLAAARTVNCFPLLSNVTDLSAEEKARRARAHADKAVELLKKAVAGGFRNAALLEQARDLAPLRGRPDFQKLVAELKKSPQR